jgi:flagellar protein FlaF
MPIGELIGATVGIILLIIAAYVIVGSTVNTAEGVASAQRDMVLLQNIQLDTHIKVIDTGNDTNYLNFIITNNGTAAITDLKDMDVIIGNGNTSLPVLYHFSSSVADQSHWTANASSISPGGWLYGNASIPSTPTWIVVVTGNGKTAAAPITI